MSFETKSQEPSLREELEKIPYHKLRAEFKERGIESAWTAGTKKAELIERALERLGVVKEAVEKVKVELSDPRLATEEEMEELVQQEIKKIDHKAEVAVKVEEQKEMSELDKRKQELRERYSFEGKLHLGALEQAKEGAIRGVRSTQYSKAKKKYRSQTLKLITDLIEEAKKQ